MGISNYKGMGAQHQKVGDGELIVPGKFDNRLFAIFREKLLEFPLVVGFPLGC